MCYKWLNYYVRMYIDVALYPVERFTRGFFAPAALSAVCLCVHCALCGVCTAHTAQWVVLLV